MFAQSMGMVIAELRAEWRQEIKRLERENIELRGKVDTLTTILAGGRTKSAEDGRRILYHPRFVEGFRTALAEARADLHDLFFKHACEVADLRREVDALRAELDQLRKLRAAVLVRQNAEHELRELYRERSIARARATERDPALPLQ